MDQMIGIYSKCIHYIHEQIDGIRGSREVFLSILTIVSEIQSAQLVHYPTERHIDTFRLQDMVDYIRHHSSQGTHETHRILSGRSVDVHPADPHTVLHQPEGMFH